jgi:hypothetical protein
LIIGLLQPEEKEMSDNPGRIIQIATAGSDDGSYHLFALDELGRIFVTDSHYATYWHEIKLPKVGDNLERPIR